MRCFFTRSRRDDFPEAKTNPMSSVTDANGFNVFQRHWHFPVFFLHSTPDLRFGMIPSQPTPVAEMLTRPRHVADEFNNMVVIVNSRRVAPLALRTDFPLRRRWGIAGEKAQKKHRGLFGFPIASFVVCERGVRIRSQCGCCHSSVRRPQENGRGSQF